MAAGLTSCNMRGSIPFDSRLSGQSKALMDKALAAQADILS